MKYFILTYGCQMNQSDSERIAAQLEKMNFRPAKKINRADLIVANMCSVRQSAVDRVYGLLNQKLKCKNQNDKSKCKIILTGCILPTDKKKLKDKVDFIWDIKDLPNWPNILKNRIPLRKSKYNYLQIQPKHQTDFSVLIPISNGCNNFCSYCVVPFVRRREKCRNYKEIIKEAKNAVKQDAKEIWLLGQNVNRYRSKLKIKNQKSKIINFAELLRIINDVPGDFWIRFTSPHPKDFSDGLIGIMAKCQKITPYLNLPLQSGDNQILKKMNRNYTASGYRKLVKKIREALPKIALSTDVIVGFPGETKKQFQNTAKLFKEIKFDMAYISKYSPRPGTAAAKLKDGISHQEKEKRWKILTEILRKTALQKNIKFIGKTVDVLVESKNGKFLIGKSQHYKTVKFESDKKLIGQFVKIKITGALPWGLKGKIIKK